MPPLWRLCPAFWRFCPAEAWCRGDRAGEPSRRGRRFSGLAGRIGLCSIARHRSRGTHVGMAAPRSRLCYLARPGEHRHAGRGPCDPRGPAPVGAALSQSIRTDRHPRPGSSGMPISIPERSWSLRRRLTLPIQTACASAGSHPGSQSPLMPRDRNMSCFRTDGIISGSMSRKAG